MKTRTSLLRSAVALAVAASLTGATALTAAAAPKDNKAELLTASAALASQSQQALYVYGGSSDTCKTWSANAGYVNAARNSINTVRQLAGLPTLASNSALNTYAAANTHFRCTASSPAQSINSETWKLLPGDPGGIRSTLNGDKWGRATALSTSTANFALGFHKSAYSNVAYENNYFSSNSTADRLSTFSKNVAWPSAGFFPVELSNGIWSFYGKNTSYEDPDFDEATVSVKNVATGANLPVEILNTSGWTNSYDQIHFKVPAATVGSTRGNEAAYEVTIANTYTGYGSSKVVKAPIKYTVKLVRTGAKFGYTNVAPKFTKQPAANVSVKVNKPIRVSAAVSIPNQQEASLQWEFRRKGESKWNTIYGADQLSEELIPEGLSLNGSVLRLRAESNAKTVYSSLTKVKVTKYASTVKITKTSLKRNKKPAVTVKASQAGKVKVTVSKGKTKITKTVKVKKNKSTKVTLSKKITAKSSGKGKWKVTVKFYPTKSSLYAGKTATKKVTVK